MSSDELWKQLAEVFESVFGEPIELNAATTATDVYGWDSVRNVELMVAVEQAFGLRFTTGELSGFANVGDLVEHLSSKLS